MRHFIWCRQELAEFCQPTLMNGFLGWAGEHVHICITTPGYRKITPSCRKKTLNLFFHDLDPEAIRRTEIFKQNPVAGQQRVDDCFTDAQAREIIAFVKTTGETNIIVNCEAGISRSPGVVLAFRRFYGGDVDEPFQKAHPNIHVTSVLSKVLREAVC